MRKVILYMHVTLDGFVCGPAGEQDWMTMTDFEMDKFLMGELLGTVDTLLVGRVLYQGFAAFWPTVTKNPSSPKELVEFANWLENAPKIVFSKTLSSVEWANSRLAKGTIAEELGRLKKLEGGDMVLFGGAGIVSAFTSLNLVDEYRIKLEPIILGRGRRLFDQVEDRIKLRLKRAKSFSSGVTSLYYETIRN
jgi:dihydrofolate reductase